VYGTQTCLIFISFIFKYHSGAVLVVSFNFPTL
jgi:hypothetical protein